MPTDEDWGRLYNFDTTGDAGLVMPPRSYYFRNFFAGSWTDMAIGMIYNACANASDTADVVPERLDEITPANLPHFGLSKSVGGVIEVAENPHFVGIRGILGGVTQLLHSPKQLGQFYPTLVNKDATTINGAPFQIPMEQGVSGTPFSAIALRFVYDVLNGRLHMNINMTASIALADDAANTTAMETLINGTSNSLASDAVWTVSKVTDFTAFYIFWPYLNNRLKLHCVGAKKFG